MTDKNLPPNLPALKAGWKWVKLGDICKIDSGIGFPKKFQGITEGKYPFYKVGDISKAFLSNKRYLSTANHYIDDKILKDLNGKLIPKNSIVFAKIGEALKLNRRSITTEDSLFDNNVMVIKGTPNKTNYLFLYYFLLTKKLGELSRSTTVPSIRKTDVEDILFPLPPLSEQKKIVKKIEKLFTELDSSVASLKKAKEQIKLYRQSVLAAAFSGRLVPIDEQTGNERLRDRQVVAGNERLLWEQKVNKAAEPQISYANLLPKGWKRVKLGDISVINPKLPFENINEDTIVSFLSMKRVEKLTGHFDLTEMKKYSEVKKGYTPFVDGDVIFAKITPCMENGKIAVLYNLKNKIGFGSTEFHVFRTKKELYNQFLFYYFMQDSFRAEAQHNMTGAVGQKRVPKIFLEKSKIPLPPLTQQTQIVKEIEKRFSAADNLEKAIDESLKQSETLRQSILKQAFEGRLV